MSMEIIANLQKFLETMYANAKMIKLKLLKLAKMELKDALNIKREKDRANKSAASEAAGEQDSSIAMELMLLE